MWCAGMKLLCGSTGSLICLGEPCRQLVVEFGVG